MGVEKIGRVKSAKFKEYEVFWNPSDRNVYVGWAGKTKIGQASSAPQAMRMAEAWLYNK